MEQIKAFIWINEGLRVVARNHDEAGAILQGMDGSPSDNRNRDSALGRKADVVDLATAGEAAEFRADMGLDDNDRQPAIGVTSGWEATTAVFWEDLWQEDYLEILDRVWTHIFHCPGYDAHGWAAKGAGDWRVCE